MDKKEIFYIFLSFISSFVGEKFCDVFFGNFLTILFTEMKLFCLRKWDDFVRKNMARKTLKVISDNILWKAHYDRLAKISSNIILVHKSAFNRIFEKAEYLVITNYNDIIDLINQEEINNE